MSDDTLRTVLNAMSSNGGTPPLQDILAQVGGDDPRVQMLMEYMAKRQEQGRAQGDVTAEEPSDTDVAVETLQQIRQQQAHMKRVERTLQQMHQELEELRIRNDTLAAALGACYLCWGEDVRCPECGGHGTPGSLVPERELYGYWVAPAARRIQRRLEAKQLSATHSQAGQSPEPNISQ